jgi:hypothetical protein
MQESMPSGSPRRGTLKQRLPGGLRRRLSNVYWWWHNRGRHISAAWLSADRRRSVRTLGAYRDRHRGERCFIIGNGPSLKQTALTRLRGETTFGMNRIYLAFPEMGFATTYYVSVNTLVIEQCAGEIRALAMPKFLTWRSRRWMAGDPGVVFLDTDYTGAPTFARDARRRIFEGSTVTYVALQLAYHMGFAEVILIGVDHRFATQGAPNSTVVARGGDPDHFSPAYFGPGFRWQLPDLEASEAAYRQARAAFQADGRRVLDATVGGELNVFPKVAYDSLFDRGPRADRP